jgi:type IV pilus modification protein PilV
LRPYLVRTGSPRRAEACDGFTLLEVLVAAVVLALGITAAIGALQSGLQALDNARNYTTAAQLMQNEMERLRLKSWSQLQSMQDNGDTIVATNSTTKSGGEPFACTRTIRDLKDDMKQIELVSSWRGYDGRPHSAQLVTRYSKTGLYDYLYTAH